MNKLGNYRENRHALLRLNNCHLFVKHIHSAYKSCYLAHRMNVQSQDITSKKAAVLQAVLELIGENGFHGVPMSQVAKNAGVAAGTIYHYFDSKDSLIRELCVLIKSRMAEAMFSKDFDQLNFRERFFKGWVRLCRYFIDNKHSLTFIQQYNSSPYAKQQTCEPVSPFGQKFEAFLKAGVDDGFIKNLEYNLVAAIVFGCIMTTAKFHIEGRHSYSDEDLTKIATIIWDGLKVPE
jgi:TetR/AcrR family transcriptional regulator, multidrug resistance operon repressor